MEPEISEFSDGYCLTEELMSRSHHRLLGAPVFPTQRQEGQFGGYDVEVPRRGLPLFLQFKLSHLLSRSNSREWTLHLGPYFRIHLRRRDRSDQHRLMVQWQNSGHEIYYSAPEFHTQSRLTYAYATVTVLKSSAFYRPGEIGLLPDNNSHYLTFAPGAPHAYFHSMEPVRVKAPKRGSEVLDELEAEYLQLRQEFNVPYFKKLTEQLRDLSRNVERPDFESHSTLDDAPDRKDPVHRAAIHASRLAWSLMETQMLLVHAPTDR